MSLVLAADYRVPDFDHWWAALAGDLPRLPGLGAHHVVVYRSLADASRVFVTIGVAGRGPVDTLLRSPVMLSWFDSAGVDEIPPMFAGEVVEKLDLDPRAGPSATPGAVIVAAIAPVGRLEGPEGLDRLRASVHGAVTRLALGVTTSTVQHAIDAGARSTKQVAEACGAGSVCGRCNHTIRTMIEAAAPDPPPRKPDRLRRRWGRS